MGLTGLESLDEFIATNHRNYKVYEKELKGIPGVKPAYYDETEKCNYQYIILEIDKAVTHVSRDQLIEVLHAENILARRYFFPGCHRMEPYLSCFPHAGLLLPETERLAERVLSLPTGTDIDEKEIIRVCRLLRLVIENGSEVRRQMEMAQKGKSGK